MTSSPTGSLPLSRAEPLAESPGSRARQVGRDQVHARPPGRRPAPAAIRRPGPAAAAPGRPAGRRGRQADPDVDAVAAERASRVRADHSGASGVRAPVARPRPSAGPRGQPRADREAGRPHPQHVRIVAGDEFGHQQRRLGYDGDT